MGAAAEWSDISPFPRCADDGRTIGAGSVTNLTWSQQQQAMAAAPLFGGRRTWRHYSFETTGYGSLELCGPLAHRVTIVHPGDAETLRRHHRLVRRGRLTSGSRRRPDDAHLCVLERDELVRTRADDRDAWLFAAQRVAQLCGTDDEVARTAGPALRQLLWSGRTHLAGRDVLTMLVDLRHAAEALAEERRSYLAAVERWITTGQRAAIDAEIHRRSAQQLVQDDIESLRLETQVLAEVRREWHDAD